MIKLDKEQFIQDLEDWHESHLDYYADFVESIRKNGHNGLVGINKIMSEFYPRTEMQVHDGMNNPGNNLSSTIESVKRSGFVDKMVERFRKGDDHAAASLYFIVVGNGMIILFTIVFDLWHDKKLSLKSLGLSRLLLSRMCKRIVKSSINSGFDTVQDWREIIGAIYEGQKSKPDIEKYLMEFNDKQAEETNDVIAGDTGVNLEDKTEETACLSLQNEDPKNHLNKDSDIVSESANDQPIEKSFSDFIFCNQEKKEQVIDYIINELSRNKTGIYLACMKLALEELGLVEEGKLKPFHSALGNKVGLVSYRQASRDYQKYRYLSFRGLEQCADGEEKEYKRIELVYRNGINNILKQTDINYQRQ